VLGQNPSHDAPGQWHPTPTVIHVASSAGAKPEQVARLRRRLEVAYRALIRQPSLADPHGVSILPSINITRIFDDEGPGALTATLKIIARPIDLADPKTFKDKSGRYFTPGEGDGLEIVLNPHEVMLDRDTLLEEVRNDVARLRLGSSTALLVSRNGAWNNGTWDPAALARRWVRDTSWYETVPTGDQPMLIYVGSSRQQNNALWNGRLRPDAGLSRLMAAVLMIDWPALYRQMQETP